MLNFLNKKPKKQPTTTFTVIVKTRVEVEVPDSMDNDERAVEYAVRGAIEKFENCAEIEFEVSGRYDSFYDEVKLSSDDSIEIETRRY